MGRKVPEDIAKVWIASKVEIIMANLQAAKDDENAVFTKEVLDFIIDENSQQLVVPILKNDPLVMDNNYYRCIVWLKVNNENSRISTLMDIKDTAINSFITPPEKGLNNIITMLLEQIEQINLNVFFEKLKNK